MKSEWKSFLAAGAVESSGCVNGIQLPSEHTVAGPYGRRLLSLLPLTRIPRTLKRSIETWVLFLHGRTGG